MKIWQQITIASLIVIVLVFYIFLGTYDNPAFNKQLMINRRRAFDTLSILVPHHFIADFHINSKKEIDFMMLYPFSDGQIIIIPQDAYLFDRSRKNIFNIIENFIIIPKKFPNDKLDKWYQLDLQKTFFFRNEDKHKKINPYDLLKPLFKYFIKDKDQPNDKKSVEFFDGRTYPKYHPELIKYSIKNLKIPDQNVKNFDITYGWGGGCLSYTGERFHIEYENNNGTINYSKWCNHKHPYKEDSLKFNKKIADYIIYTLNKYKIFEQKEFYEAKNWSTGAKSGGCHIFITDKNNITKEKNIKFIGLPMGKNNFSKCFHFLVIFSKQNLIFHEINEKNNLN